MNNERWFETACGVLVGGVDSPVRAWKGVGGTPRFFVRGSGSGLVDVEGTRYTDYVCSWGPLILGHAHPEVVAATVRAVLDSSSFGAPSPLEVELGLRVQERFPSMELLRFVNSGTEATMTAIRLARAFTERKVVVKFAGGYHGHHDGMLVAAGSGALALGHPSSPGVCEEIAACTLVLPYNDVSAVEEAFDKWGKDIAAVIVEPWAGNMGLVAPLPGFLESLRTITRDAGTLLIFDEVITGFRVPEGGVQQRIGLTPDLTCLGKIVGGGFPVGAVGGRRDVMERLSPLGPVYQAGTLAGNPVAMAAGVATLDVLARPGVYDELEAAGARLECGLREAASRAELPVAVTRLGSVLGLFFAEHEPRNLRDASATRGDLYPTFFHGMLERGHYFAPSAFEAIFVSLAHGDAVIDRTVVDAEEVFRAIREQAR